MPLGQNAPRTKCPPKNCKTKCPPDIMPPVSRQEIKKISVIPKHWNATTVIRCLSLPTCESVNYLCCRMWQLAYEITRANRLWRILMVDTDISMDAESESCKSGVLFKSLSALPVISTFHVDSLITSPGWLAVGTWNTGFTECKASEKYPQGRHRPTMEIWTRSRIHVTAAFYPRDAMLSRVFATATCPSVRHTPVLCLAERKQDHEMYTIW